MDVHLVVLYVSASLIYLTTGIFTDHCDMLGPHTCVPKLVLLL